MKKTILAAAAAALLAVPAAAQTDSLPPRRNLITVNPIGFLTNYFNVEYERAVSDVASVSIAGERSTADDDDISAVDVRFRYYPQGRVFQGFSLGASLGYGEFNEDIDDGESDPSDPDNEMRGPTLGLQADYSWLVGRDRRLFLGLGIGVRRLLSGGDSGNDPTIVPGGRYLGIGFTF